MPDLSHPSNCTALTLRSLSRAVSARYDAVLRPLGLTIGQLNILLLTQQLQPLSQADMARRLAMNKSTLSRDLEQLVRRQWLHLTPGRDLRVKLVQLTPAGQELVGRAYPAWEAVQYQMGDIMSSHELPALQHLLKKLVTNP